MAVVDQWDNEEGYICQGNIIGFVELSTAVVAGEPITFGTPAANKIVMKLHVDVGDSPAVALKGGVTGDKIPACFHGVVKMLAWSTITVGQFVLNAKTAGTTITYGGVVPMTNATGTLVGAYLARNTGTGTCFILGQAIQAGTTVGNELLILIGSGH